MKSGGYWPAWYRNCLGGDTLFESEKDLQRYLWNFWDRFPRYGFLNHIRLIEWEWWIDRSAGGGGRVDFLAYDSQLVAHVIVELKNSILNPYAVIQAAEYVQPARKVLGDNVYALLIGPKISRDALNIFYSIDFPMRLAITLPWTTPNIEAMRLGYLRDVSGVCSLPDGNCAMIDFVADRQKHVVCIMKSMGAL